MANGTNGGGFKMPGFFVGGGIALSNTALLLGLLGVGAILWYKMQSGYERQMKAGKMMANEMKPAVIEDKIANDVYAFAAQKETVINNQDRVKEAIRRMEPEIKGIRDEYRDGRITRAQYNAKIQSLWQRVMITLGIPTLPPDQIPNINQGRGFGYGFGQYSQLL